MKVVGVRRGGRGPGGMTIIFTGVRSDKMSNHISHEPDLSEAFQAVWGKGFKPYCFQCAVAQHLLNGHNVILQAPTGAGKTKAALFPFLYARQHGKIFSHKLLYTVPMRVLAKSFYSEVKDSPAGKQPGLAIKIQTGENQDDRQLRSNIIFTTIDQTLSSFLNIPYALGFRQGNVNAGAVVGSYLVFDEFHLFDPDTSLPTLIEVLKMLNGIAPFLLMTATFSEPLLDCLATWLDAKIIKVTTDELRKIPSQQGKRREYRVADRELLDSVDMIIAHHQRRSIVICNTVARAQEMYRRLQDHPQRGEIEVVLLHSRFLKDDRQVKEDMVRNRFKRGGAPENIILVATQVIEVGLDITCETLHTEVAPASAIFQRAGRCARFENESGIIIIYPVPTAENGKPNYHPYAEFNEVCAATFTAFQERSGSALDFVAEQEVINEVHGEHDKQMLDRLCALPTRRKISACVGGLKREMARELIRENDSITVFINKSPELLADPFKVEGFSLYRGTVFGQWQMLREKAQELRLDWIFKYPFEEKDEPEEKSVNTRARPTYDWKAITSKDDLRILPSVLFSVHPRLVAYDSDIGFRFELDGAVKLPQSTNVDGQEQRTWISRFRRETYTQHIQNLMIAYEKDLREELSFAAARLEGKMNLPAGAIDRAVRLCIALHDMGKLTVDWQRWAHEWQSAIGQSVEKNYMLAHTDYDASDVAHRAKEQQMKTPRPPHAVEGMRAVALVIGTVFGQEAKDLTKAALTAIARHHSPRADEFKAFTLHPAAETELKGILNEIDSGALAHMDKLTKQAQSTTPLTNVLVQPDKTLALLTYFLIVRALRLADQWATEQASKQEE